MRIVTESRQRENKLIWPDFSRANWRWNDHNNVLGAGASLHAGFPLASAMGEGLLDFMLRYPMAAYPSAAQFLIDTFGKSPNIENLITTLQSRIDALNTPEGKAERMGLGNCRGRLTSCLREWFREIHTKPAPEYAEFGAKIIQPGQ